MQLAGLKQRARAIWAAGDYAAIAEREVWPIGERIVRRIGVRPGEEVLDVACGTGNAAIRAAQAGGRVVGVDLTPELLATGRRLAAAVGVAITWLEGDAEALPVEVGRFDVVVSTFGCMFAPRHGRAARELARVLRPGGRLAVCSWTPEGAMGRLFRTMATYLPPPPAEFAAPPALWGAEDHVRGLFRGAGVALEFERGVVQSPPFDSLDAALAFYTTKFGPLIKAREQVEASGRWPALLQELTTHLERNEPAEYLVALGRKRL